LQEAPGLPSKARCPRHTGPPLSREIQLLQWHSLSEAVSVCNPDTEEGVCPHYKGMERSPFPWIAWIVLARTSFTLSPCQLTPGRFGRRFLTDVGSALTSHHHWTLGGECSERAYRRPARLRRLTRCRSARHAAPARQNKLATVTLTPNDTSLLLACAAAV
jgi:hypothetical protein